MGWKDSWRPAAAGLAGLLLAAAAACSSPTPSDGDGGDGGERKTFKIGVSNGFVGSEWRTQMLDDIRSVFEEYKSQGAVSDLVVESADVDVNGQIQQIRNLINSGVDAIIVNPNSPSALNAVFAEAKQKGIVVVPTDQAVTSPDVTNVVIDQAEWARRSARWLAEKVGRGASIVAVNGLEGHPANEARWNAAKEVFDEAGVKVAAVAYGQWDQATGQQVTSNLLASHPGIKGIWTQDGMALGVYQAVEAAKKLDKIVITGEARAGFMKRWEQARSSGFTSIGVVNPPGVAGSALHVTMNLLQGKKLRPDKISDGNTVFVPIPGQIDEGNFLEELGKVDTQPDAYVVDGMISASDAAAFFQ